MTWTCPNCGRNFRNTNQWHSCESRDLGDHLARRSPQVREMIEKLVGAAQRFGEVEIDPVKTSIQLRAGSTFLSIRPKKAHLEIDFSLARLVNDFPVYKTTKISSKRVLHQALIEDVKDINDSLIGLLREAYELVVEAN